MLQFEITQSGQAREVNVESDDVIIGRHNERTAVGLDLTPDDLVSRTHARLTALRYFKLQHSETPWRPITPRVNPALGKSIFF